MLFITISPGIKTADADAQQMTSTGRLIFFLSLLNLPIKTIQNNTKSMRLVAANLFRIASNGTLYFYI